MDVSGGASFQQEIRRFSIGQVRISQRRFLNFVRRTDSLQFPTPCQGFVSRHLWFEKRFNAHMESFFKTLNYEEVHLSNYETLRLSMTSLTDFSDFHQAERELTTPRPGDIAGPEKKVVLISYTSESVPMVHRNRNLLFPVLAAIITMRGLTIILWIV
jgi:hypothetical protein